MSFAKFNGGKVDALHLARLELFPTETIVWSRYLIFIDKSLKLWSTAGANCL